MSDANFLQEVKNPSKLWAEQFLKIDSFQQIVILHNLYCSAQSLTIKLQILTLLAERVINYQEVLFKAERSVKEQLEIIEKVKQLTCGNEKKDLTNQTLTCGLPKNHIENPLTKRHQTGNVFWD